MIFGLSGSESRSRSDAQSTSRSNQFSVSGGLSDSFSTSFGESRSRSESGGASTGRTRQSIAFEPFFANLFTQATGAAGDAAEAIPELTQRTNALFNSGFETINALQGESAADRFLTNRLSDDTRVDERIDLAGEDISRFLQNEVLPNINAGGIAAGTLGGSRGEVARGEAGAGAVREFARVAEDIRTGDRRERDAIAQFLSSSERADAATSLSALPSVAGLAQLSSSAALQPFAQLSSILGPAQTLTAADSRSDQFSVSESDAFNRALAEAMSRNFALSEGESESQSTSSSRGRSRSFGFNFGDA